MEEQVTTRKYINEYIEILQVYGVSCSPIDYYWQVGEIEQTQGWIIHLSVIRAQLQALLETIIPGLLAQQIPFRFIRDEGLAFSILEGSFGYTVLGKLVSIYPRNEDEAKNVVRWVLAQTASFRGPHIPTDRHLGGIVYTRYGSFNPVLVKNINGEWVKHIYDSGGQLICDPYHIPFTMPEGVAWPFGDIALPEKPKSRKLLNSKYYPLYTLKADVKGDVLRALYFRRLWQIKSCLIKQGRPNMFADAYGRDIQDRLRWQYELYLALHTSIPMPRVFDYFEDDSNVYLAMEFIKGQTLTNWIVGIYKGRSWRHLQSPEQLQLLDQLLKVLNIIRRLHEKGYIHRDITPDNFLVDKKNGIFLIDMELTWSALANPAQPPFQQGTPGHMSPEQMAAAMPTVKEDIYGIGSLMFVFLTNLYALKINKKREPQLLQSLEFFIGDITISRCILACWSAVPAERPSLRNIIDILKTYREKLVSKRPFSIEEIRLETNLISSEIRKIVQSALNNLGSPELLSPKSRWISQSLQKEVHVGNQQLGMEMYEGWHTGMAGPLWLVALAKGLGYSIEACETSYNQSWDYIETNYFGRQDRISPGLYAGNAGIALALVEGLNNGLLPPNPFILERLQACFSVTAGQVDLAEGVAGQGLALLQSLQWLDKESAEETVALYVQTLIQNQHPDGSWNIYTGIDRGAAGIIIFLLSYIETFHDDNAKHCVIKALGWLERIGKKNSREYSWPIGTNTKLKDCWGIGIGMPGIGLAFIKAYETLKEPSYRKIAEQCLLNITPYPVILDFSLSSGLAGLGETFLEAFRIFKDPMWEERANWLARFFIHCYNEREDDSGCWLTLLTDVTTADLFSGNGGIIHFLIRFLERGKIKLPISAQTEKE